MFSIFRQSEMNKSIHQRFISFSHNVYSLSCRLSANQLIAKLRRLYLREYLRIFSIFPKDLYATYKIFT
jgi:hypothetical protein